MNDQFKPHKSSLGLDANIIMLLAYFGAIVVCFIPFLSSLAWIVPLIIFLLEKDSKYVKFHAMQALFLEILGVLLAVVLGLVLSIFAAIAIFNNSIGALSMAGLTTIISLLTLIIMFIFSLIAVIKGWSYECYKIPLIGDLAQRLTLK